MGSDGGDVMLHLFLLIVFFLICYVLRWRRRWVWIYGYAVAWYPWFWIDLGYYCLGGWDGDWMGGVWDTVALFTLERR